jgi:hypothetical protein
VDTLFNQLCGINRRHFHTDVRPEIQLRMHNVDWKPVLMYGSDIYAKSRDMRRMKTFRLWFPRSVSEVILLTK